MTNVRLRLGDRLVMAVLKQTYEVKHMKMLFAVLFCCSFTIFIASCGCDSLYVEGTATIVSVTDIDSLTACGWLAEVRYDFTPDDEPFIPAKVYESIPQKDILYRVIYYKYPPKRWLDSVGIVVGTEHRCSYVRYWGSGAFAGSCGGWDWDYLDIIEEGVYDSCKVWEEEE